MRYVPFPSQVMAGPFHLNWGGQVNPGRCDATPGTLVINVTLQVTNDGDTRVGGGFWALDDYNKHIQVWQVGTGTFCAVVRYMGSFVTLVGPSPQGTDSSIAAGIEGTFEGGYNAIITGTLKSTPLKRTKGNLGAFNYNCQSNDPGDYSTCTGIFSWTGAYFDTGYAFNYEWWGWIYHAGSNGTWVNRCGSDIPTNPACTGNQGDITD